MNEPKHHRLDVLTIFQNKLLLSLMYVGLVAPHALLFFSERWRWWRSSPPNLLTLNPNPNLNPSHFNPNFTTQPS